MAKHDFSKEDINSRKVSSKEQRTPSELKIEGLETIQSRFDEAMNDIKGLSNIYTKLSSDEKIDKETTTSLQDLLRSQVLLMESALDLYMHEVSKYGISKMFNNHPHWRETVSFRNYKVTLGNLKDIYYGEKDEKDMANMISNMLQYSSYMKFDAIIDQLVMIGVIAQADSVPNEIANFRPVITDLSERRNIIAHASDRDFKKDFLGRKQKIEERDVIHYYDELIKFVSVIQKYLLNKD